mmetsp:Transcript_1910/g.4286  ORF Transcript_1910/g.4286 Transcript_1910/m.4286 type:complete len:81 (+) Transcript_1910:2514-2756(+)
MRDRQYASKDIQTAAVAARIHPCGGYAGRCKSRTARDERMKQARARSHIAARCLAPRTASWFTAEVYHRAVYGILPFGQW